jgi:glycosyltransferase involved in cell wall biosynthesis
MSNPNLPTFSICIPNYNYGRYIGETIQSVLDQTYPHFEIIVADNASTDNSVEVVKSFKDERIRLIQNRYNIGFAPNLQRATMNAQNDFINLLSSDDQMKPNALESYAQVVIKLGEDAQRAVLFSQVELFDNQGRITGLARKAQDGFYNDYIDPPTFGETPNGKQEVQYEIYRGSEVLRDSLSHLRTFGPFLSIVYHRSLWEAVEGYSMERTIGPDKHFNYKLLSLDPYVVYVPLALYRYRDHPSDNRAAQNITLRQPIDDYLYTVEFSEEYLRSLGSSRQQLVYSLLDRVCLKEGLVQLGLGNYAHAFRLFAFAFASYPGRALRMWKTYVLMALLLLGPLSRVVAPALMVLFKRLAAKDKSLNTQVIR